MRSYVKRAVYLFSALALITLLNFPYDVDQPLSAAQLEKTRKYYEAAYKQAPGALDATPSQFETCYSNIAAINAKSFDIAGQVGRFIDSHGLKEKRVLDVGSGRGYLQDLVADYTGLDISPSVARFYHKKFVVGSATAMPFENNTFDGAWSIWVQEHVPNPEQYLSEIRRVVKNNGVIFLHTAWFCSPWASHGYQVRPYSDFDTLGKLTKATIPVRVVARELSIVPVRTIRRVSALFGPTSLHYQRLKPNYDVYWQPDSDAVNSIDAHEAAIWFITRGDECVNCESSIGSVFMHSGPLVIRVHK